MLTAAQKKRLDTFEREHPDLWRHAYDFNHCICGHDHGEHEMDLWRCMHCDCDTYLEPGRFDNDMLDPEFYIGKAD